MSQSTPIDELVAVMAKLRDPEGGCPWDREQTFESIVPHTLEEAYEVADAIEKGDRAAICDELGDLLFQVVYYAQLGSEEGAFDLNTVAAGVRDKMIRRHPHVFGERTLHTAAEQRETWEAIKAIERADRGEPAPSSALDGVPMALPALTRSAKLQARAAKVGFDWPDTAPVFGKIREELEELEQAVADNTNVAEELGDLLLATVNLARKLKVDPEQALREGNRKFERRFSALEDILSNAGEALETASFERLEAAYQLAKAAEKPNRQE